MYLFQIDEFIRKRITQFRLSKGLSEYQLSYKLGHSRGYINNITSGKTLPSMSEFFHCVIFFEITPADFFDTQHQHPELVSKAISEISNLCDDDVLFILTILNHMQKAERE